MANREEVPKVNAGSMADIAFLLLIFFLVTTSIETDTGLDRKLPRIPDSSVKPPPVSERNILEITIDGEGKVLVEDEVVHLTALKALTTDFVDNGGALFNEERFCDYCQGERDPESSDSPVEAIVSLTTNRETSYGVYITVQNELVAAYNELRNREAQRLYNRDYTEMEASYLSQQTTDAVKYDLKVKIKKIQQLFPLNLSEAKRN